MAVKRITMQDVADACGLSRNTISKIFNGRGSVSESTRRAVVETAKKIGYVNFPENTAAPEEKNIAILSGSKLRRHHFGAYFVTSFTDQVCRSGYNIKMYEITDAEIKERKLPPHLQLDDTAGILCIELFDQAYQQMIAALGLPCLFVDGYARENKTILNCDFVTMENYAATQFLVNHLIDKGARCLGFVGDKEHCNSFYERWSGFGAALSDADLPVDRHFCILEPDGEIYADADRLAEKLNAMPRIPDALVCANDFIAIHVSAALKKLGKKIPDDVMVTGFDGSPEAMVVEPSLTTVSIDNNGIGRLAAVQLISRIRNPGCPPVWTAVTSTPILGGSTKK